MTSIVGQRPVFGGAFLFVCALAITGCGSAGDVKGTITYKGKPVAVGSVLILDQDKVPHVAPIQRDGSFAIAGVRRGEAKFAVSSPDPRTLVATGPSKLGDRSRPTVPPKDADKWFPLPSKFGDPIASGLKITVRGGINAADIDLIDE